MKGVSWERRIAPLLIPSFIKENRKIGAWGSVNIPSFGEKGWKNPANEGFKNPPKSVGKSR
jgi:hypothetical protein